MTFEQELSMKTEEVEEIIERFLPAEEGLQKTENKLIHIGKPIPFETNDFLAKWRTVIKKTPSGNRR